MKKSFLFLLLSVFAFSTLTAQSWWRSVRGNGNVVKKDLDLPEIDAFSLSFNGDVYVRQGDEQSVTVEMEENLLEYLNTEVRDGKWRIKFDKNVRTRRDVKIYLTVRDLQEAYISGSGSIVGENTFRNLGNVEVGVSGSGDIKLDLEGEDIDISVSGSGDIVLTGQADQIDIGISGSGDVRCHELVAAVGKVRISGSGDVTIHATENLQVRTSGSGDVEYKGTPRLSAKSSGSGDISSM